MNVRTQSLVARTFACEPRPDLLDTLAPGGFAWIREGVGFVAGGVTVRVAAGDVDRVLCDIHVEDHVRRPGSGAIAVGSLPFLDAAAGTMTIPAWVEGQAADGSAWRTEIGPPETVGVDRDGRAGLPTAPGGAGEPGRTRSECLTARDQWDAAVRSVLADIEAGSVTKVVLARTVRVDTEHPVDPIWLLRRLAAREPDRYLFASDGIVGASPELLVRRAGTEVISRPLAGTAPWPHGAAALDALNRSPKDRHEHAVVVDAIARCLGAQCATVDIGPTAAVGLADLAHLSTTVRAAAHAETPSALGLALALHPTPAVGGLPVAAALEHIHRWEPRGRGRYAGPVGWVDGRGDGAFAVALRSAELDGRRVFVRAGAGVVVGSEPAAEWREIDAKLAPVLRALTVR